MKVTHEDIAASVDAVWSHLVDPARMQVWMTSIEDLRTEDGGPVATGSTLIFRARGADRTSEVVELEPRRTMALRSVQGSFSAC